MSGEWAVLAVIGGALLALIQLILYIYLITLAARYVAAFEHISLALAHVAKRYVNGPGPDDTAS